jgi:hypothetical protein
LSSSAFHASIPAGSARSAVILDLTIGSKVGALAGAAANRPGVENIAALSHVELVDLITVSRQIECPAGE